MEMPYNSEYYQLNKNKILQQRKEYYNENKEELLKKRKERYKNNIEAELDYLKKYRNRNKSYFKDYMKFYRWYDKNYKGGEFHEYELEYGRMYNRIHSRRKAEQARQNRLAKYGDLGSRETEIISKINDNNDLLAYLIKIKQKYRL